MESQGQMGLTTEQKFALKVFSDEAKKLPREKAIEYLIEMKRQEYAKTNFWVSQIKTQGI